MATRLQLRKGTTAEHSTFTGANGEVTVDTTKKTLVLHDGVTVGGHPVAAKTNTDGTISLIKKDGTSAGTINADGLFNNTLTSTNTNQALTAAQGKVLKDSLDTTITSSFGIGQTWQNMTESRALATTYTNSTSRAITICVTGYMSANGTLSGTVDGSVVQSFKGYSSGLTSTITLIVPPNGTYSITGSKESWWELR